MKLNKMHIITQSDGRENTLTGMGKPIVSRLHLLKEAGERKIQTGLTTRVTLVQPDKKYVIKISYDFKLFTVNEII